MLSPIKKSYLKCQHSPPRGKEYADNPGTISPEVIRILAKEKKIF
jgi:hypothetical protein